MTYITSVTEKRIDEMVKEGKEYGETLKYFLNQIKCQHGCYGETVSGLKKIGLRLYNNNQFNVEEDAEINGLNILYHELIQATFCLDLHHVTIPDFNKLVKVLYEA